MEKVILFGGSFDPVHNGHIFIAKKALEFINGDKAIFIISSSPRWKEIKNNDEHREKMMRLALEDEPNLDYSTIEFTLKGKGKYTIDTIEEILKNDKKDGKKRDYYFLIGEDQLEKLHDWHRIDELCTLIKFIAYNRDENDFSLIAKENAQKYCVQLIEGKTYECSSTLVRELKSIDVKENVLKYIVDNHLYKYDDIYKLIDDKRYRHSVSVAFLALEIAKSNNLDKYKCFIASMLHDVGKDVNKNIHYMEEEWTSYKDLPFKVIHQFIGASIAKHEFDIKDEDILSSIAYHCSGRASMSLLERVVYASDKMDPLRKYDSSALIKACLEDIENGFVVVLDANKEYLENKSVDFNNLLTDQCFKFYLDKE